jgi:SPP1 gp7 family putative phage head morphogenesis protein
MADGGPSRALHATYAASLSRYMEAVEALSREALDIALVTRGGKPPRVGGLGQATDRLASVIRDTQMAADAVGRRDTLDAARRIAASGAPPKTPDEPPPLAHPPSPFGGGDGSPLPRVVYHEAVADILARRPMLAVGQDAVASAYNEQHAFAMARAVESTTVDRAQRAVAKAIATGRSARQVGVELREIAKTAGEDMDGWTRWYSETVAETNMNTAYSAGRFRQMADPAVASVIGALMFDGPQDDSSTRPNHAAAVGLIAAPDDPVWNVIAPPLGFRCRHYLSFVNWETLKRMGLVLENGRVRRATIPAGAHADPGFRHTGRPDIAIYGGA